MDGLRGSFTTSFNICKDGRPTDDGTDGQQDGFRGSSISSSLYLITERTHWMTKSKKTFNEVLSSVKQFSLFFDNYRFWFLMSLCENRVDFFILKKISVGENLPNF